MNFLHSHLDVSDKQGERFYEDIKVMEERYQGGLWDKRMMPDQMLESQKGQAKHHSRKSRERTYMCYIEY